MLRLLPKQSTMRSAQICICCRPYLGRYVIKFRCLWVLHCAHKGHDHVHDNQMVLEKSRLLITELRKWSQQDQHFALRRTLDDSTKCNAWRCASSDDQQAAECRLQPLQASQYSCYPVILVDHYSMSLQEIAVHLNFCWGGGLQEQSEACGKNLVPIAAGCKVGGPQRHIIFADAVVPLSRPRWEVNVSQCQNAAPDHREVPEINALCSLAILRGKGHGKQGLDLHACSKEVRIFQRSQSTCHLCRRSTKLIVLCPHLTTFLGQTPHPPGQEDDLLFAKGTILTWFQITEDKL